MSDSSKTEVRSIDILYNESKSALDAIDQLLIRYRTNATAVLALGTGATALFGFSNAPKCLWFAATLSCYALGVIAALLIYAPRGWRDDIYDFLHANMHSKEPPEKLQEGLVAAYQKAIKRGRDLRVWRAAEFMVLLAATAGVVIFAGIDSI